MFEGSIFLQEKIIFIKMNTRGLSDGSQVPVGQYRCTGTVTYEAVLGASRTVPAFAELSAAEKEKIYQEEKKAEKERKEREIIAQPKKIYKYSQYYYPSNQSFNCFYKLILTKQKPQ